MFAGFLALSCGVAFFDHALATGLLVVTFLMAVTFTWLFRAGFGGRGLYMLLCLGFLAHTAMVLLIYYTGFKPVGGGGDYELYHSIGTEIARRFSSGYFSLDGLFLGHGFSLVVGALYIATIPAVIVGNMLVVWFFVLSLLLVYLIVLEIGASRQTAFLTGLMVILYPSYLYLGSLLLKDTLVIPLVLAAMLLNIKMVKHFSWEKFFLFFIILTLLVQVRFYIGYAMLFSFTISWFLVSHLPIKKRSIYGVVLFLILGACPMVWGDGYYGSRNFISFLNPEKINFYRSVVYNPSKPDNQPNGSDSPGKTIESESVPINGFSKVAEGLGSSFTVAGGGGDGAFRFSINSVKSFVYSFLGPFPWQLRYTRQYIALLETIPWYMLLAASFFLFIKSIKNKSRAEIFNFYKWCVPLIIFGIIALGALSLFINNYGIIARIRIPIFISGLCVMSLMLNNVIIKYEKIFSNRGSWLHRFKHR